MRLLFNNVGLLSMILKIKGLGHPDTGNIQSFRGLWDMSEYA
jgi:hypothetical protein